MLINVARTRGYLENILPPKGYLGQKSLGSSDIQHVVYLSDYVYLCVCIWALPELPWQRSLNLLF